ncbi:MAG: response regulator [Leptospiraceae bacterium]|nr:response regulator [Leptospiraceae bacterium]MCB1314635.1 response regulator [Leptospiraceae bacterium]MCB1319766.1 response regulator [Leptospiraceae bacterium]
MQVETKKHTKLRRLSILHVDDDPTYLHSFSGEMAREDCDIVSVCSMSAARRAFQDRTFDLILMDADLGQLYDGVDAAVELSRISGTPVVFLSVHTEDMVLKRAEQVEPLAYLYKGSGPAVIRASLRMLCRRLDEISVRLNSLPGDPMDDHQLRLMELRHRTLNSFAVLNGLIEGELAADKESRNDERLQKVRGWVQSAYELHAILHASPDKQVLLRQFLQRLTRSFEGLLSFPIRVTVADILIEDNLAMTMGVIVSELILNANKHAFGGLQRPENLLEICAESADGELLLSVTDNGHRQFQLSEVGRRRSGSGMEIISSLLRILNGQIQVEPRFPGNCVLIRLPLDA